MIAKRIPLTLRILSMLEESSLPVPTPDIVALCCYGVRYPRQHAHIALGSLLHDGLVSRGYRATIGKRKVAVWTAAKPTRAVR